MGYVPWVSAVYGHVMTNVIIAAAAIFLLSTFALLIAGALHGRDTTPVNDDVEFEEVATPDGPAWRARTSVGDFWVEEGDHIDLGRCYRVTLWRHGTRDVTTSYQAPALERCRVWALQQIDQRRAALR